MLKVVVFEPIISDIAEIDICLDSNTPNRGEDSFLNRILNVELVSNILENIKNILTICAFWCCC